LSPIKEDTKFWHHLTGFSIAYYFAVYASVLFQCSPLGQLFKCKLIGLDQILTMGCSKGKEGIWNQIRSGNPILVLIWIKPSVCVQNMSVGFG